MPSDLLACPECDTLQYRPKLKPGRNAKCIRCQATIFRSTARTPLHMLALVLTGLVIFLIANTFPIVSFKIIEAHREATIIGSVKILLESGRIFTGLLVFATALFMPLLDLSILLYLLWPRPPHITLPGFAPLLRLLQTLRPWGMIEVLMLGLIVAIVKLSHTAEIIPGVAIWAYMALTLTLSGILTYNPVHLWALHKEHAS